MSWERNHQACTIAHHTWQLRRGCNVQLCKEAKAHRILGKLSSSRTSLLARLAPRISAPRSDTLCSANAFSGSNSISSTGVV